MKRTSAVKILELTLLLLFCGCGTPGNEEQASVRIKVPPAKVDIEKAPGSKKNNLRDGDLSTPQKSWKTYLDRMKAGDLDRIKQVVTDKGYASLISVIDKNEQVGTFRMWGVVWGDWDLQWIEMADEKYTAKAGPETKETHLEFVLTNEGWKLDRWSPGE